MSSFHSFLEKDSNFDLFVLVLSVSAESKWTAVENSTFLIGALPEDSVKDRKVTHSFQVEVYNWEGDIKLIYPKIN